MKNILVTGGFGFLGSHLIELLLAEPDNHVHVVDNLSTSPLPLEDLLGELVELELPRKPTYKIMDLDKFCKTGGDERYDEIYHLASVVGPAGVLPHAGHIAELIVNDTMGVANLALTCGAKLVDVSTSEVYGGGQEGFCSETMSKVFPAEASARLEYAAGKLAAEIALFNLCQARGLDTTIVRPFNIAGPRQSGKGGFVLPRFVGQAIAGVEITVFGNGSQIRAFTHVKDIATGIVGAMRNGKSGDVYNLGNPANRCSILELAQEVKTITGSRSQITFIDPKTIYGPLYKEADNKFPDASKALAELGWKPRYGRKAAIEDTFMYMKGLPERLLSCLQGF